MESEQEASVASSHRPLKGESFPELPLILVQ